MKKYEQTMIYKDGLAQPVFPFTDGKSANYDPATSAIVRYCVYIETDYDMDGDGKLDRVKAFIQVPRSAVEGHYKAATLYEPRPYVSGVNEDAYPHMHEIESEDQPGYDLSLLDATAPKTIPTGYADTMELAMKTPQSDWYFPYPKHSTKWGYEAIDTYNYYLVRGFAVVLSSGFGTYGSDGFEFVGSHYERDAFTAVVEWLHGDRMAYTDRTGSTAIRADWSNGNVAATGRSYAGTMPFAMATTGVAGLKTIVPVAGIADWYSQQNMQGAQRYWPGEMLNTWLCYFCTSQYGDPTVSDEHKDKLNRFLHQVSLEQLKSGFDYSDFWKDGNYTLNADQIRCSALIVHGLHDENVSTKQFEMMLHSFLRGAKEAGQVELALDEAKVGQNNAVLDEANVREKKLALDEAKVGYGLKVQDVKLLLHQGPHITPSMPNKNYVIDINGEFYDDIVNEWLCHYLYDVDNGAEKRPAVLVQSNVDQKKWFELDSWEVEDTVKIGVKADKSGDSELMAGEVTRSGVFGFVAGDTVIDQVAGIAGLVDSKVASSKMKVASTVSLIDTDWEAAGVTAENYDEKMSLYSSNMNKRFLTEELSKEFTIQGTVCVNFRAALAAGDADQDFHPTNPHNADALTMKLATAAGKMDDVKLVFLLCDVSEKTFTNIASVDPERNIVPMKVVCPGGFPMGGGADELPALDICEFETVDTRFNVITRAYIDLCNPESGYDPVTAKNSIALKEGEYHDYHVYLNATRYTLMPGHRLVLVVATEDPVECLIHKEYQVAIENRSVEAVVPVTEDVSLELSFTCEA